MQFRNNDVDMREVAYEGRRDFGLPFIVTAAFALMPSASMNEASHLIVKG